jgi:hypothetical protein
MTAAQPARTRHTAPDAPARTNTPENRKRAARGLCGPLRGNHASKGNDA